MPGGGIVDRNSIPDALTLSSAPAEEVAAILKVEDLRVRFHTQAATVFAVNGVSFELFPGETLGIVGESGSGKSVSMLSILQLIAIPPGQILSGQALFDGVDLIHLPDSDIRKVRGSQIGMIFQDPMTYLNPVIPVGDQIAESLILHRGMNKASARVQVIDLLRRVGIPEAEKRFGQYPHQLSGGMRQRVMIAMALACNPKILIADEPTTALDVTIQAQIIDLVKNLRDQFGMSIIWITHDLGIVAGLADRVMVMYAGFVVETALVRDLYEKPSHPYTLGLLDSLPRLDTVDQKRLRTIQGLPPILEMQPLGCPFAPRCEDAFARCQQNPVLRQITQNHSIACWWDLAGGKVWDD